MHTVLQQMAKLKQNFSGLLVSETQWSIDN